MSAVLPIPREAYMADELTVTQVAILQWIANGKDNVEIALLMNIERPILVQRQVQKVMDLSGTATRSGAVAWALRKGLIK